MSWSLEFLAHLFRLRADLKDSLAEHCVGRDIHYPILDRLQPAYAELWFREEAFPNAEAVGQNDADLTPLCEK